MKVVLDSNILLVAIGKQSRHRLIWEAFISAKYHLIVADELVYEYEEILQQHSAPGAAEIVMDILVESPQVIYQQIITHGTSSNKILMIINFLMLL